METPGKPRGRLAFEELKVDDDGRVRSISSWYFDDRGRRFSREDYGQKSEQGEKSLELTVVPGPTSINIRTTSKPFSDWYEE